MKVFDLVLFLSVFVCFSGLYGKSLTRTLKTAEEKIILQKKTDSTEFIASSFRSTCEGLGFSSFEDWKETCRTMWNLESIGYEKKNGVWHGFWSGSLGEGEVYQKEKKYENFSE